MSHNKFKLTLKRYAADLMPPMILRLGRKLTSAPHRKRQEKLLRLKRQSGKKIVHFLHIGKTGGTAISKALSQVGELDNYHLVMRGHGVTLADIPIGDAVVFFLRDPISRYVSGFYSRQRQGAPRYSAPWGLWEMVSFSEFHTANELASSLGTRDLWLRLKAQMAMRSIRHINRFYWDWLVSEDYLISRKNDVMFVGFQESLSSDFVCLRDILNLPSEISLPTDPVAAHRAPNDRPKELDDIAIERLRDWYSKDYECIRTCQSLFRKNHTQ